MLKALEKSGAKINAVYYCTHRDEDHCPCRKPKAGLIKLAVKNKKIDLKNSFLLAILSAISTRPKPPAVNPSWFSPEQKSRLTGIAGQPARILLSKISTPPQNSSLLPRYNIKHFLLPLGEKVRMRGIIRIAHYYL